jgi:leucyl/phenylalanyl-tRNA--protein transferase
MAPDRQSGWRAYRYDPRGVLPVEEFHVPRRLLRSRLPYRVTHNQAFQQVIASCVRPGNTWISQEIEEAFSELHQLGWAHSFEAWQGDELVGGLYGLALGATFCGESMFHRAPGASKATLLELHRRLVEGGFDLIDCQEVTPTLAQFGARWISFAEYFQRFRCNREKRCNL